MTKAELDREIIERKFAQLSEADSVAIMSAFTQGCATSSEIEASIQSLLNLNLIKKISPHRYVLTSFGKMMKNRLITTS